MRKIFNFLFLLLLIPVFSPLKAQVSTDMPIRYLNALPSTCSPTKKSEAVVFKTTDKKFYVCTALNTWTALDNIQFNEQNGNLFFAGPDGARGFPTFRALATGDVPLTILGTGPPNATTFLRGDGTWSQPKQSPVYALRFDHSKSHNVYVGKFWNTNEVYGEFFFDALVKPEATAEYVFSAGYGGWHNLLFGFSGNTLSGNISNATGTGSFLTISSGVDTINFGEWYHIAVGYYNGYVTVYINGVPCRKFAKADGRNSLNGFEVDGYIGGSDHSNFHGLIRYVRLFDDGQEFLQPNNAIGKVFKPELEPRAYYFNDTGTVEYNANLLLDFSTPSNTIPDLSNGFEGRLHHGRRNLLQGFNQAGVKSFDNEADLPQWEIANPALPTVSALSPAAVPTGALVFDSFNRKDVTYLFSSTLGLGQTEAGSAGVKNWVNSSKFGILTGRVFGANEGNIPYAYIDAGQSQILTQIDNVGNETNNVALYSSFNFTASTGIWAYHETADNKIYLFKQVSGVNTQLGNYTIGSSSTPYNFAIENTPSNHIKLYVNGILRVDYDNTANAAFTGTQAGFNSHAFNRIDNFLVKTAS